MTDLYCVLGNPIAHSKSPLIHAMFARQTGQDLRYEARLAPLDGFAGTVRAFVAEGGRGANVTVPFKQEAWTLADTRTARAELAEAANTLVFADGRIHADNTDGAGLVADLVACLDFDPAGRRILVAGAGGATQGVLGPLLERGPSRLFIANRTACKARDLAARFAALGPVAGGGYDEIGREHFDLVLNATSASLADELPPLPPGIFAAGSLAYDMMYGRETPFLRFSREHGAARLADGLGMLVEQAAEAFFVWRGVRPDTAPVRAHLLAIA